MNRPEKWYPLFIHPRTRRSRCLIFMGIAMSFVLPACSETVARPQETNPSSKTENGNTDSVEPFDSSDPKQKPLEKFPLDPERAMRYLVRICRIGKRISGSEGMKEQQKIISKHFTDLGAKVFMQSFQPAHPLTGKPVRMNNLIVSWHPDRKERVLVACHYDTRPYPDEDPRNTRGKFIGANDGASGVALLMEMGNHMKNLKPTYGVDFVFFDGEELVYIQKIGRQKKQFGEYFHGSKFFAKWYRDNNPQHTYKYGILFDMVGGKNMQLFKEKNSTKFAPKLTQSIWDTAEKLKVSEFVNREKHEVEDDHLPLNQIAKIPTTDIIDFDYRYWHTVKDIPRNCSGKSMVTVGKVVMHWLENVPD